MKEENKNNDIKDENINKTENLDEQNGKIDVDDKKNDENLEDKLKESEDKYLRLFAEFQNFRNRTDKEKSDMYGIGMKSAILKFLPVVDNIERAISNIPEDIKNNSFVDGIDKVYKQIQKIFEELNIKPIEALGKEFDANLHNAVMTDEESDAKVDTITEEMLKGYMIGDEVLRHSMVKVKK